MENKEIPSVHGFAIDGDDMNWTVECPSCNNEIEYEGYFDATDICRCSKCNTYFLCEKVWLDDNTFIK